MVATSIFYNQTKIKKWQQKAKPLSDNKQQSESQ